MYNFAPLIFVLTLSMAILGAFELSSYQLNKPLTTNEVNDLNTKISNTNWESCHINLNDYSWTIPEVWKKYQYDYNRGNFPKADYVEYYLSKHQTALTKSDIHSFDLFIKDCNKQISEKNLNLNIVEKQKLIFNK